MYLYLWSSYTGELAVNDHCWVQMGGFMSILNYNWVQHFCDS